MRLEQREYAAAVPVQMSLHKSAVLAEQTRQEAIVR